MVPRSASRDPPPLRLNLFGGPVLMTGGTKAALSSGQRETLGVIAAEGPRGVTRAALMRLIWDQEPDSAIRRRLSQRLYSLKRDLGPPPPVETDGRMLRLNRDYITTDLDELEKGFREGEIGSAVECLEKGFLSAYPDRHRRAEEWLNARRLDVRSRLRRLASRLLARAEEAADWTKAGDAAAFLLALDPDDEGALRRLVRARAIGGQLHEAEATYRTFCEAREESWEPEPETLHLLDRLRSAGRREAAPVSSGESNTRSDPPLVGRGDELRILTRFLDPPFEDGAAAMLVLGEAGIGKSRLVKEALAVAPFGGALVLTGRSSAFEHGIPLSPILESLACPRVGRAVERLEDPWRSVVLDLLPDLLAPGDSPATPPEVEEGEVPRRLSEALLRLLLEVAQDGPIVLFLDDFHWADVTSITVLDYIRRRWRGSGLRLVITARSEEVTSRGEISRFLTELGRAPSGHVLRLDELTQEAAGELIREVSKGTIDETRQDLIFSLGGRSPFLLIELTTEEMEGRLGDPGPIGGELTMPLSVREVLEPRLKALDADANTALELLTVLGRPLLPSRIARLTRLTEEESAGALDRLEEQRLLRWEATGAVPRHGLVTFAVYSRTSQAQLALLHRTAARFLESSEGRSAAGEVALHYSRARQPREALRFALEAADRAEASGAVTEAIQFLELARKSLSDEDDAGPIIHRLSRLHYLHRDFQRASPLLALAGKRFGRLGRRKEALLAAVRRVDVLSQQEEGSQAEHVKLLEEIKEEAERREHWDLFAEALDVEVHLRDRAADVEGVRQVLAEAEELIGKGDPKVDCSAYCTLAINLYYGCPTRAIEAARAAVDIARQDEIKDELLKALNRLILVLINQVGLENADGRRALRESDELARTSGDLMDRYSPAVNKGVWEMYTGAYAKAEHSFRAARAIVARTQAASGKTNASCNLGILYLHRGEPESALEHLTQARASLDPSSPSYLHWLVHAGIGVGEFLRGNLSSAGSAERTLPPPQPFRFFDPYPLLLYWSFLFRRKGQGEEFLDLCATVAEELGDRLIPAWINARALEAQFRRRMGKEGVEEIVDEISGKAAELGLHRRLQELRRITS